MSLSASFSDFPTSNGSHASFTPGSDIGHSRSTASSMGLIPVTPVGGSGNDEAPRLENHPVSPDRRSLASARAGRPGMERRQFGSSHAGLSAEGRELAAAIDTYKLQHHRRYITCDEMLVVLGSLGYEQKAVTQKND